MEIRSKRRNYQLLLEFLEEIIVVRMGLVIRRTIWELRDLVSHLSLYAHRSGRRFTFRDLQLVDFRPQFVDRADRLVTSLDYARTVPSTHPLPQNLPDPSVRLIVPLRFDSS